LCAASSLSSISSTSGRAVKLLCTPLFCTQKITEQILHLVQILSDANGNVFAKVWE
jgi:hypothetical protein